jgi:YYY domain-containing protein
VNNQRVISMFSLSSTRRERLWLYDVLFLLVFALAGYLRLTGVDWGEGQHQHPDENFLSGVLAGLQAQKCTDDIIPIEACPPDQKRWLSIADYFDSDTSTLNPYNRGYSFFVYGNLPLTIVRVAADAMQEYDVKMLGRQFSALADLFTILILYLVVSRLYNRRVALLASLFSALTVMQIQQSHFFTTDLFVNTFAFLAIWFAVKIMDTRYSENKIQELEIPDQESVDASEYEVRMTTDESPLPKKNSSIFNYRSLITNPLFLLSIGFGFAFGMALASKVNIYPLAILLPGAFGLQYVLNQKGSNQPLKTDYWQLVVFCLIAGGFAAIISFRIFQPYAFDGLGINQQWIANIQEQRAQAKGDAEQPWSLQWARRSHLYSFENLTLWGLGLPLGILAWAGFLLMGWRIFKGEWHHALLWGWTALYFLWQSLQFNPTMRYQLPIYPLLAMMAAWFVFELAGSNVPKFKRLNLSRIVAGIIGIAVVILTAIWAFAFHSIYIRNEPRIAASRWIFQNVPGPINVQIQTESETYNQPLSFPSGVYIKPQEPYQTTFTAQNDGLLREILLAHVAAVQDQIPSQLYLTVWQNTSDPQPLASAFTAAPSQDLANGTSQVAIFDQSPILIANQTYYLKFEMVTLEGSVKVCGPVRMSMQAAEQVTEQTIDVSAPCTVSLDNPYTISFVPQADGTLNEIVLEHVTNADVETQSDTHTLSLFISKEPNPTREQSLAGASVTGTFTASNDPSGDAYTFVLDQPVVTEDGAQYYLRLEVDSGMLTIEGSAVSNETDYDYGLPFRVDGYDAFGGIYRGDLTLQVYWPDNEEKLNRYVDIFNQTEYIFIPTNHQYAQITRIPERYPLTTLYYRELMGCPADMEIIPCYHEAKPGDYQGRLGFELVEVFETFPKLGPFEINDQYAEEAFTFYDHPKVFIFKKSDNFNIAQVSSTLGSVDLTKAIHLTPRQFKDYSTLMLSPDKLAQQRAGGTWSQLFDYDWIQNHYPVLGLVIWYLFIFLLGLAVYPLVRLAMPGLADKGYPLSRALGLVLFGYLAWIGGSLGIPYTRTTIAIVFGLIVLLGAALAYYQRDELREEWKAKRKYFLLIEGLFLAFLLFDLVIRLGNPDLWHHAKGGERPMDFSYFNAVIKSTSFPPYDPWFAGGYINYYYYGFVLVGTPVKLLGIVPSIAYNFILPTLFAIVGICAFSIGWNLLSKYHSPTTEDQPSPPDGQQLIAGLAASALTLFLGNLGTIQLIFQKLQQIGAGGAFGWESTITIFQRWTWAIQGLAMVLKGTPLAIGLGDWYWNPSRVVPPVPPGAPNGYEITEFPLFTFIYSDLHAHMIAMLPALLALSWALAVVAGRAKWRNPLSAGLGLAVGGLIIGALYPSNLSDIYTYLPIGLVALGYTIWRYSDASSLQRRLGLAIGAVLALTVLSFVMYQPYRDSYSQVYSALDPWKGPFTPIGSYLTHWSLLLFIVVSWMAWETREWMAETLLSALQKLKPYPLLIEGFLVVIVIGLLVLAYLKLRVGWIALPIAAWAGVLVLRPNRSDSKRFVLFLIGTALLITIVVEVVVVRGDIGRQNTIFKFYLQSWFLLAVSAGAAFAWTIAAFFKWLPGWRVFWQTAMILLLSGAALFTVSGASGKIRDRWIVEAPHTLDAMTFMNYAQYDDFGQRMDLSEDYRAIRWMQDNVQGSPVIVEANCPEYRWCTRFTIYTGLPGVVGWNWHQRQQRGLMSTWVEDRVAEVGTFYNNIDTKNARTFLKTYDVSYIIVGQLERAAYTPEGISKFEAFEGKYWRAVYRDTNTVIYEVIP